MTLPAWGVLRLAVTVAILGWLARDLNGSAAMTALRAIPWWTATLAVGLVALDRWLMFLRWRALIGPFSTLSASELRHTFFVSAFVGSFLPAGIGGDAARAYSMSRGGSSTGSAVASVVLDRWLGLLAVGLSGCVGLLLVPRGVAVGLAWPLLGTTAVLVVGTFAALHANRAINHMTTAAMRTTWPGRQVTRLGEAVAGYRSHKSLLIRVAGLSLVVQAGRIVLAWLIGVSLGIALPFGYYWAFMPLNILIILLPLSVGGFGLPQGAMVWTLQPLGVAATDAFLLSVLFVGTGVVGNLPGAWMFATGRGRGPAR